MLGLVPALVPGDGNCALHCEVAILKEADSMKHAKTTHDSLRAEMCSELLQNSNAYQGYHVGNTASYHRYVDRMKKTKTYVDHLGLQALAALYPNELGRIVILSIHTGKVVQHHFMDSSDPSMKEFRKDAIISRTAVEAATLAGVKFMKFKPGEGEKERGGHYDNLHVIPDHKDDDKSTPVINNESQQSPEFQGNVGNEQQVDGGSSDIIDINKSSESSESSESGGESGEEVHDGKSDHMHIQVKRGLFLISCHSFKIIFCIQL